VPDPEPVPERALAVYGHPDDPEIAAGGTLAAWAAAGCEVWLLVTTRGDKGSDDPAVDREALVVTRREETAAAASVLGLAGHRQLDHDDGTIRGDDERLQAEICAAVRELRPEVVLCPDPTATFFGDSYFNHRDHRATGWATLDAVAPAAGNPHYFPEQVAGGLAVHQVGRVYLSGTLDPNCWIDISAQVDRKIDALFCHRSQLVDARDSFREFLRERAALAGREAGLAFAEGFRRLTLAR
jgi:LmbE family N-acetylglucosaminyl deacetylase